MLFGFFKRGTKPGNLIHAISLEGQILVSPDVNIDMQEKNLKEGEQKETKNIVTYGLTEP